MGTAIPITDATFEAEVLRSPILTVVDFWADWCAPCKRLEPILDRIAAEYAGRIKISKLDAEANPRTVGQYGVTSLPTLLLFRNGQVVDALYSFMPRDRLLARFLPHLEG